MTSLTDYQDKYPSVHFERRQGVAGVVQMTLHHEGGEFIVTESALRDLGRAFLDVGEDHENKVVILTGTGERFATRFDYGSFVATVPGDGMHTVWTTLLGLNRGRHFLLTGRTLTAHEALEYGVVGEVLPQEALLPRAWELASKWATYSQATLRGTRAAVTREWRRLLSDQLHTGLTHEAFAGAFAGAFDMPENAVTDLDPRR
jgi:enoyl-CoA hydratase/carnithine racemase